jgi:hypothetical protein
MPDHRLARLGGLLRAICITFLSLPVSSALAAELRVPAVTEQGPGPVTTAPSRDTDDIIVLAPKPSDELAGESNVNEQQIAASGTSTIGELLARLRPYIKGNGEPPVILINGKPIGFDQSYLSYPAEALQKVSVLERSSAERYGATSGTRVINLVLKDRFISNNFDLGYGGPTAGGQTTQQLGFSRTVIHGDSRWNIVARGGRSTHLLKSSRVAETPAEVTTSKTSHPFDYETLIPSSRNVSFEVGLARPIGRISTTTNLEVSDRRNEGMHGIQDNEVLKDENSLQKIKISTSANAKIRKFQFSLSVINEISKSKNAISSQNHNLCKKSISTSFGDEISIAPCMLTNTAKYTSSKISINVQKIFSKYLRGAWWEF